MGEKPWDKQVKLYSLPANNFLSLLEIVTERGATDNDLLLKFISFPGLLTVDQKIH